METDTVKKAIKKLYPYIEEIPRDKLIFGYIKNDKLFRQPYFKVYEKDNKWFFEYKKYPRFFVELININGNPSIDIGDRNYLDDKPEYNFIQHQNFVKYYINILYALY